MRYMVQELGFETSIFQTPNFDFIRFLSKAEARRPSTVRSAEAVSTSLGPPTVTITSLNQ